jgi:hypothetical protein
MDIWNLTSKILKRLEVYFAVCHSRIRLWNFSLGFIYPYVFYKNCFLKDIGNKKISLFHSKELLKLYIKLYYRFVISCLVLEKYLVWN